MRVVICAAVLWWLKMNGFIIKPYSWLDIGFVIGAVVVCLIQDNAEIAKNFRSK